MHSFFNYRECLDDEYEHAKDHLKGLLEDIYTTGSIDDLERHLEEVCAYFGLAISTKDPVIAKKPTKQEKETERMLQNWMGYTRGRAEVMCGSKAQATYIIEEALR